MVVMAAGICRTTNNQNSSLVDQIKYQKNFRLNIDIEKSKQKHNINTTIPAAIKILALALI